MSPAGFRRRIAARLASVAAGIVVLAMPAAAGAAASVTEATVTGPGATPIALSYFRGAGPAPRPTVLVGHGFGGTRDRNPDSPSNDGVGGIGLAPLLRAGYNVLTWDARGFGESGGTISIDGPATEGRDVSALIDWVARRPDALQDAKGDPRVGMAGGSYGGAIQWVAAARDRRLDALAPSISWNSLATALFPAGDVKLSWAGVLYRSAVPGVPATVPDDRAALPAGRLDPHVVNAYYTGNRQGTISPEDAAWFASRGPGATIARVRAPALITQGTSDTLFGLDQAVVNERALAAARVPVKMLWFCGGHRACAGPTGPPHYLERATLAWFGRYLRRDRVSDTGAGFGWLDDAGRQWRTAPSYPPPAGRPITASGAGTFALASADSRDFPSTGTTVPAAGLSIAIPPPARATQVVGAPRLTMTYTATGTGAPSFGYAQLVDRATGRVAGQQAAPVPIVLDGAPHTVAVSLPTVALALSPASRYDLVLSSLSEVFQRQRADATVTVSTATVTLPTVDAPATARALRTGRSSADPSATLPVTISRYAVRGIAGGPSTGNGVRVRARGIVRSLGVDVRTQTGSPRGAGRLVTRAPEPADLLRGQSADLPGGLGIRPGPLTVTVTGVAADGRPGVSTRTFRLRAADLPAAVRRP